MIKAFRITTILFALVKIFEHMQIIYFLMRAIEEYHWNFSFLVFVSVFLNFISLDQFFISNPSLFRPVFYGFLIVMVLVFLLAILVSVFSGWGKKPPLFIRLVAQFLCFFCYMEKTVLFIPIKTVTFIAVIPAAARNLNIEPSSTL